jgi:hypothetical protein
VRCGWFNPYGLRELCFYFRTCFNAATGRRQRFGEEQQLLGSENAGREIFKQTLAGGVALVTGSLRFLVRASILFFSRCPLIAHHLESCLVSGACVVEPSRTGLAWEEGE